MPVVYRTNPRLFQFVILVVDSTDRERLSVTREELHKLVSTLENALSSSLTLAVK
jgi:ADP-ribosylation factor family